MCFYTDLSNLNANEGERERRARAGAREGVELDVQKLSV